MEGDCICWICLNRVWRRYIYLNAYCSAACCGIIVEYHIGGASGPAVVAWKSQFWQVQADTDWLQQGMCRVESGNTLKFFLSLRYLIPTAPLVHLRVPLPQNAHTWRFHHDPAAVAHQRNVLAGRRPRRCQEHMDHVAQPARNAHPACHPDPCARHTVPGAGRTPSVDPARGENLCRSAASAGRSVAAVPALWFVRGESLHALWSVAGFSATVPVSAAGAHKSNKRRRRRKVTKM